MRNATRTEEHKLFDLGGSCNKPNPPGNSYASHLLNANPPTAQFVRRNQQAVLILSQNLCSRKQTASMILYRTLFFAAIFGIVASVSDAQGEYGLDCSWPIKSTDMKCGDLLADRKAIYEEYMNGCRENWGERGAKRCNAAEAERLDMSVNQPRSMVVSE
jgi:hypothetical protein